MLGECTACLVTCTNYTIDVGCRACAGVGIPSRREPSTDRTFNHRAVRPQIVVLQRKQCQICATYGARSCQKKSSPKVIKRTTGTALVEASLEGFPASEAVGWHPVPMPCKPCTALLTIRGVTGCDASATVTLLRSNFSARPGLKGPCPNYNDEAACYK